MTTIRRLNNIPIPESSIQSGIRTLLLLDGWHILETDAQRRHHETGSVRHPLQERGMADMLGLRYGPEQILWIECKRRGGRLAPHQKIWISAERARGALVVVLGEDCEASIDGWLTWYSSSRLMRRPLMAATERELLEIQAVISANDERSVRDAKGADTTP